MLVPNLVQHHLQCCQNAALIAQSPSSFTTEQDRLNLCWKPLRRTFRPQLSEIPEERGPPSSLTTQTFIAKHQMFPSGFPGDAFCGPDTHAKATSTPTSGADTSKNRAFNRTRIPKPSKDTLAANTQHEGLLKSLWLAVSRPFACNPSALCTGAGEKILRQVGKLHQSRPLLKSCVQLNEACSSTTCPHRWFRKEVVESFVSSTDDFVTAHLAVRHS